MTFSNIIIHSSHIFFLPLLPSLDYLVIESGSLGHVLFLNSLLSFLTSSPSLVSNIVSVWHIFPLGFFLGTSGWQNVVWFDFLFCVGRNLSNWVKPGQWPGFLYLLQFYTLGSGRREEGF